MTIEDEIYEIENNPTKVVNDKIETLIMACSKIPNSVPKSSGNKTMYQHLQDMKRQLETDPTDWLAEEKARLEQALIDRDNEVL